MASFTEDNNYRRNAGIEVLNGENYYAWKFDMKMLLVGKDVWDIVTGEEVLDADASDKERKIFRKRENQALSLICLNVSQGMKIYVRSAQTSKEAWDSLSSHFEEKTLSKKIMYRRQLYALKKESDTTMTEHINKLKTISEHLESLDDAVLEKDLVMILISSLTEDYNNLITTLETLDEEKLTWDYVRDRICAEYERKKEQKVKVKGPEDALFCDGHCGNRNKNYGSRIRNESNEKRFPCHHCQEIGHYIKDCPKKRKEEDEKKEKGDVEKEDASFCRMESLNIGDDGDFFPEFALHVTVPDQEEEKPKWLLDSACSQHITGNRADLTNFKEFEKNDNSLYRYVKLADESVVCAKGVGNLNLYLTDEKNNQIPITFKNVLHVPNIKRLISIGQLTRPETGAEVTFKGSSAILRVNGRQFMFGNRVGKLYEMNYSKYMNRVLPNPESNPVGV